MSTSDIIFSSFPIGKPQKTNGINTLIFKSMSTFDVSKIRFTACSRHVRSVQTFSSKLDCSNEDITLHNEF